MRRHLAHDPGRLMRSLKSILGTSLFEEKTQVRLRRYMFAEIVAGFLRFLRQSCAPGMGGEPRRVVLGRPRLLRRRRLPGGHAGAAATGIRSRERGLQGHRIPVRADRGGAALRGERRPRGDRAGRRHRRRHLGFFGGAGIAAAQPRGRPQGGHPGPAAASTSAAPISTACSVSPSSCPCSASSSKMKTKNAGAVLVHHDLSTWHR